MNNKTWKLLHTLLIDSCHEDVLFESLNINKSEFDLIIEEINLNNPNILLKKDNIYLLNKKYIIFSKRDFKKLSSQFDIEVIDSLSSTNKYLSNYIQQGININNKIIIANQQLEGKGRQEKVWKSVFGNSIIFSLGLTTNKNIEDIIAITLVVSYIITKGLQEYCIPVQIKWPNDIVIGNKKLGGILIESFTNFANNKDLIIGVGLNYNNIDYNYLNLETDAISNYADIPANIIIEDLINNVYSYLELFLKEGFSFFKKKYLNNLRDLNKVVKILNNNNLILEGKIIGIDDKGALILLDEKSDLHYLRNSEVSLRII